MRIIVTNDDSHASPLLLFLINFLQSLGSVTVIVPRFEQSWRGKSITRFERMELQESVLDGHPIYTLDGTPADCANIGVHHLYDTPPDLLISGINAGQNTGSGFIMSSGTVGACLEANVAGVPAIALSQHLDWQLMKDFREGYIIHEPEASRLRQQIEKILSVLLPKLFSHEGLFADKITYNVNFPYILKEPLKIVPTSVGNNVYGSLFSRVEGNVFEHDLRAVTWDQRHDIDARVIDQGLVSVSLLDIRKFGQLDSSQTRNLKEVLD